MHACMAQHKLTIVEIVPSFAADMMMCKHARMHIKFTLEISLYKNPSIVSFI